MDSHARPTPPKDINAEWIELCQLDQLPIDGAGQYTPTAYGVLSVWRLADGGIRVIDDACPHAGASLSAGRFDADSHCVVCPWHAWAFDIDTGCCPDNPQIAASVYESRVKDGKVWIKRPASSGAAL